VDSGIFNPRDAQLSTDHVVGQQHKHLFSPRERTFFLDRRMAERARVGFCVRSIGGMVSVRRAAARRDRTPKRRSIDGGGGGQPNTRVGIPTRTSRRRGAAASIESSQEESPECGNGKR